MNRFGVFALAMLASGYSEVEICVSVPGFKGYSAADLAALSARGIAPIMGGDGRDELAEIRKALGIDENADPVAAIAAQAARIITLEQTIAADPKRASQADIAETRAALNEAQGAVLRTEAEFEAYKRAQTEDRRQERARHKVELLLEKGKVTPAHRERALGLALSMTDEAFDEFVKVLPQVDFRERGIATDAEMAELEPTETEIKVAQDMGTWDATDVEGSKRKIMRAKAAAKGVVMPEPAKA